MCRECLCYMDVSRMLQENALRFPPYDEDAEKTFESRTMRLENYFELKNLTGADSAVEKAKRMLLLDCLNAKQFHLLAI